MTNPIDAQKRFGSDTKINSRSSTKYKPMQLSDDSVYNLAQHYYTAKEIAERFNIGVNTLLQLHGDAFHAGKDEAFNKPRMLLNKVLTDFMGDMNFSRMDVPTGQLLKAIELHAKMYQGLGTKQEIEVTQKEPVNASSFKFTPLTPENKDKDWKQ